MVVSLDDLLRHPPVLFEGAMGTQLMQHGLTPGQPGEVFTLQRPELVADVHRAYVAAGAHFLKTNTFNANRLRLQQTGLSQRLLECNRAAVRIAREQAGPGCAIAGSIGPTGAMFEPAGTLNREDAVKTFFEQAECLDGEGVDIYLAETMYDRREALAALEACRRASARPVIVTMTFVETPRGFYTMMGDPAAETLAELVRAGAWAVGANCTLGCAGMVRLARAIRGRITAPILIQPNAGQPQTTGTAVAYPETPQFYAESVVQLVDIGVQMIGGCCGTTPEFLAAARQRMAGATSAR